MSNHVESSQTISSDLEDHHPSSSTSAQQRISFVERYRRGDISKGGALLAIQSALQAFEPQSDLDIAGSFASYLDMLDAVDSSNRESRGSSRRVPNLDGSSVSHRSHAERDIVQRERESYGRARSRSESFQPDRKRARVVIDESLFPWSATSSSLQHSLSLEHQVILQLLDSWANDPTYVVRKIMLAPGCPAFPLDQWTNIVKGLPVELDKVLGAHYTTNLDFFKTVQSHGDWFIAFGKTIEATAFAIPQRFSECTAWKSYMSDLFASIQPCYHYKVINFDKAVRLRVAKQKVIRLIDYAAFGDLRITHLSPIGVGLQT